MSSAPPNARRKILRLVVIAMALLALLAAVWALGQSRSHPMTDAGSVDAPVVNVSALVPGQVEQVVAANNQPVQAGDLLFVVDPAPYRLLRDQAQAQLAAAQSELAQGQGNVALQQSNADVAVNQITRARNNLDLARQTLARLEPLLARGYVTAQEVDSARTAVHDAEVTLDQAQAMATGTAAFAGNTDTRRAGVDAAQAAVALAERNLRNTEIRAPIAGVVTGLTLTRGDYVVTGTPLFSLIDTAQWRVSALFRETDLAHIQPGDRARVFLLAAPNQPIEGRVASIGWGVRSTDEAQILGLPLVANSLDWVRSAARFPVEIELEAPPEGLTRLGASASVRILGTEK